MRKVISLKNPGWLYFLVIATGTFFGLDILKTFLSLLVNFLRERPAVSLNEVAIYALVTFLLVFTAGFLFRLRYEIVLWVLTAGLCIARLVLQVNPWAPLSLAVSALGTILWMAGFIFFVSLAQQKKPGLLSSFFPGIIFGITLTTAVHGLFGTWDMIWRQDWHITFIILLIIVIKLWLVYKISRDLKGTRPSDGGKTAYYTLTAFMPLIFLQLLKFQNVAAFNAVTGRKLSVSLAIIIASNIAAFGFTYLLNFKKARIPLTILGALFVLISFWPGAGGNLYIMQVVAGNIGAFWMLAIIMNKAAVVSAPGIPWKNIWATGISGVIFFIFAFVYYGSYDLVLPFENWIIPVAPAVFIAVCAIVSSCLNNKVDETAGDRSSNGEYASRKPVFLYLMAVLLVVPLIMFIPPKNIDGARAKDGTIRLINYNIHQGFNIKGYLDLENTARVIERSGADVACLQEVSRGWLINGSADNLSWLSDRLGMNYLFMPASDDVWGNAILSRYPLKMVKSGFLPRLGAPLRRSFLIAEVEIEGGENINVMCVHLHHIKDESWIREEQIDSLLEEWGGLERTAITGDFNAETDDAEIKKMHDAGFIDSQLRLGKGDTLTWVHYEPFRRIDYIWVTDDLEISNADVPYSTASDHLPVVININ